MDHAAAVGTGVLTYIAILQNNPGNWQSNGALNSLSFYQGAISEPIPSIPEPETYAMLIAGLALIGFARRKAKA